jgi:hypothetical protein
MKESQKFIPDVDARAVADGVEIFRQPFVCGVTAELVQRLQKSPIGIGFARRAKSAHLIFSVNGMDVDVLVFSRVHAVFGKHPIDELDPAQFQY